jgi:hypothetical protein
MYENWKDLKISKFILFLLRFKKMKSYTDIDYDYETTIFSKTLFGKVYIFKQEQRELSITEKYQKTLETIYEKTTLENFGNQFSFTALGGGEIKVPIKEKKEGN